MIPLSVCAICGMEAPLEAFLRCRLGHTTCPQCFEFTLTGQGFQQQAICQAVDSGVASCKAEMLGSSLLKHLSTDVDKKIWKMETEMGCGRLTIHCPCGHVFSTDGNPGVFPCPDCGKAFCGQCREASHPGDLCPALMAERKMLEKISGGRSCPHCAQVVARTEGCAKMTCRCGHHFCWLCGQDITEAGYIHFENSQCTLYGDRVEDQGQNQGQQGQQDLEQVQRNIQQAAIDRQLADDEELARRLQEEEDA